MKGGSLLFLLGILAAVSLPEIPVLPVLSLWLTFLLLLLFALLGRFRLVFLLFGFLWVIWRADVMLTPSLPTVVERKLLYAAGTIVSLPTVAPTRTRFVFSPKTLCDVSGECWPTPGRVLLSWYGTAPELIPGDQWRLPIKLKRPRGMLNPGGFDYEKWLFQNRIRATGYVASSMEAHAIDSDSGFSLFLLLDRVRFSVREQIFKAFPEGALRGLLLGLAIGDRSSMDNSVWATLTNLGVSHLLAISGLHIGLVFGVFYFFARWLWAGVPRAALWIAAQRVGVIAGFLGAVVYACLSGFSIPTQRALIMLSVMVAAILSGHRFSISNVVAIGLFGVLLVDPFAVLTAGFWLSFAAVAYIVLDRYLHAHSRTWIATLIRMQVVLALGTLPWLLLLFQKYPLWGIPANLIAVPWMGFVVIPLVLCATLLILVFQPLGLGVLKLAGYALDPLWQLLSWASALPNLVWHTAITPVAFIASLIGIVILLSWRLMPHAWVGLFWLVPLFFPARASLPSGVFSASVLDVGQGLSVVIKTSRHTLVYDTGSGTSSGRFNAGRDIVLPFLRHAGTYRISALTVSHPDRDHAGGALPIIQKIPVDKVVVSQPISDLADFPQEQKPCIAGERWNWDGVPFEFLHPTAADGTLSDNDRSCVLKVGRGRKSILLLGDLEKEGEKRLISRVSSGLSSAIMVVGHHGSRSSSSTLLLDNVLPKYAVISAGYLNRYHFPHSVTVTRLLKYHAKIISTAEQGGVEFIVGDVINVRFYRAEQRRFWHEK